MAGRDIRGAGSDLSELLRTLRRRKWTVMACAVLALAAALFVSLRSTPEYQSGATVQVNPFDPNAVLDGFANYAFLTQMQTEVAIASSPQVADLAAQIVAQAGNDRNEQGSLSVDAPTDTTTLDFVYTDTDPARAQMWANAYATAYQQDRQNRANSAYTATTTGIDAQIDELNTQIADRQEKLSNAPRSEQASIQTDINGLLNQVSNLNARKALIPVPYDTATVIIAPATLPTSPSSPNPIRDGLLGLILGLGLGVGIAFLKERLDDRTFGKKDLEAEIGAPVIGVIPRIEGWRKRSTAQLIVRDAPKSPISEAYRSVRTNIQFMAQTEGIRVIAITSASLGEGKTTTAANLAMSLVQADLKVVVISADLRKPRLHQFFSIDNTTGLSDLLEGRVGFRTAVNHAGHNNLLVMPSGPITQHPAELLSSARMGKLIESLRGATDIVLIDTPPLLAVSDTLPIARMVDGVIVVADAGSTTRSALAHVREQLQQVGARIVGGIYNNVDTSRDAYYGTYYGYGGYGDVREAEAVEQPVEPAFPDETNNLWS